MTKPTVVITVPASTANLGPGFDSVGLALNRYLRLEASYADEWTFSFEGPNLDGISPGKDNLIYDISNKISLKYGKEMPPCHVKMTSGIPLGKGMGSSAAAIVAAIELANQMASLSLTQQDKVRESSLIEGHPDNAAASVCGGLVIGSHSSDETFVMQGELNDVDIIMMVPSEQLLTKKARGVLPTTLSFSDAVLASSVSNVLVGALLTNNWSLAGEMMTRDLFHQPHRMSLVPGLKEIVETIKDFGAYGAALSGAGPTLIVLAPANEGKQVISSLKRSFLNFEYLQVQVDNSGVQVEVINETLEIEL
ncbi:homoserine kinase [Anaerobacillus alkalidiazotrophicus]|uniref:Homoserine kinase n=1 Tax=Anaerobacillus alkalidiazotrophicus TaxID=472963 RepID=A0A1S2M5B3_9BACI|nr:homoserine kinase [Anaerobacillus alkalidiazotrophicus]OIJ18825.1 homoserine kinase [Anaerobacillus alkalidiazotrophicus]